MPRYFLKLAYHGAKYHGWQIQPNGDSIQAALERALGIIYQQPLQVVGSSRTDTGVHAQGQVAHLDLIEPCIPSQLIHQLNGILPQDIAVLDLYEVPPATHARFAAEYRLYHYYIHTAKSPFCATTSWLYPKPLNHMLLQQVTQSLVGRHNFQSFSRVKTAVKHFECLMMAAAWTPQPQGGFFTFQANRFLRGMVRALVGSLLRVGNGQWALEHFQEVWQAQDRRLAGPAVPPHGLHLMEVGYPDNLRA